MENIQNIEPVPQDKQIVGWKKQLTTVTFFSKAFAFVLFISLPFLGFFLGIQQEKNEIVEVANVVKEPELNCKEELKNNSSEETTKNNTYQNSHFGFSFEYPKNFETVDADWNGAKDGLIVSLSTETPRDSWYHAVYISEIQATSSDILKEKFDVLWASSSVVSVRKLKIDSFEGVYINDPNGGIAGESTYYFITPEGTVAISSSYMSEEPNPTVASLKKIKTLLETIKDL